MCKESMREKEALLPESAFFPTNAPSKQRWIQGGAIAHLKI